MAGDRAATRIQAVTPGPPDESFPGHNGREDRLVGDHLDTREPRESETHRDLGLAVVGSVVFTGGEFDHSVAGG